MRGAVRALTGVAAAALLAAACSSGGGPKLVKPTTTTAAANATTTTFPPYRITSDPLSLAENAKFTNVIHSKLLHFCGPKTQFRRNISTPPSFHYPIIGGEAICTVWHQYTENFAFKNTADVAKYVRLRTAVECGLANNGKPQTLYGLHWVLRPHSATLATSNDFMHVLAAVIDGTPHTQFCKKPTTFVGAWNEMDAINTLMKRGAFTCGTFVIDVKNPIYRGTLLLDSKGRPLAIHAVCSANPSVQVIGISPTAGDPADKAQLARIQQYLCKQTPNAQAIRGVTGLTIVPDVTLAQQLGKALTTPVTPICS